jgi:hypothetical protein
MKRILLIVISLVITGLIFSTGRVMADGPFDDICAKTPKSSFCKEVHKNNNQDPNGSNSVYGPDSLLAKAISLTSLAVGVASVIMIIVGGLKFVTSSGDSAGVTSARNTVLYAVIGLVIAATAQSVVLFVLNKI